MKRKFLTAFGLVVALALVLSIFGDADAASLNTNLRLVLQTDYTDALDLVTSESKLRKNYQLLLATGTAANQADMIFHDQRVLTASSTEDLDVNAGGLSDAFGTTFTIAKLKMLLVCAAAANTNDVVLGGDTNEVPYLSAAATTHTIAPGGCFCIYDPTLGGWTVTAATGDVIQVANSGAGTSVTYDVVIVGTSS
jgi:hypothetical protein